jgi:hypothetical protein
MEQSMPPWMVKLVLSTTSNQIPSLALCHPKTKCLRQESQLLDQTESEEAMSIEPLLIIGTSILMI